ncbi:putative NADP-dependent oxidoreductase YfmJ [Diplonema papillatum]|nr:putative NADP-dependent oxidoreductase YfmJ [Diplonema papillatum]
MSGNQEWQMTKYPEGMLTKDCMQCVDAAEPKEGDLKEGEIILEAHAISVDPFLRGLMTPTQSYAPNYKLNQAMTGFVAGKVLKSACPKVKVGDSVSGMMCFRKRQIVKGSSVMPAYPSEKVPITNFVGGLGMPGITALLSLRKIAEPKEGEYAFVSGGAGAVGSSAIQLLKAQGLKVIASAGTEEKVQLCKDLGADAAFNYKTVGTGPELEKTLSDFAKDGLNIYYDNVGGRTLEAALNSMANGGRIVACGSISQYNNKDASEAYGIKNLFMVTAKSLKLEGFIVLNWMNEFPPSIKELTKLAEEGKLIVKETIKDGFDKVGEALIGLFTGENVGKMIVKVK